MTLPVRERRKVITNIIIKLKKDGVDFNKLSEDEITDEDIKMAKELWGWLTPSTLFVIKNDENGYVCEVMDNTNECLGEYQDRNYVETTIMAIEVFENDKETK